MLFNSGVTRENAATETRYLKECIASASSIVAIFDLFRRTFGDRHVVLSLAYSIYIASSIFLLNLQAANSPDEFSLRRMGVCVSSLEGIKDSTPGMRRYLLFIPEILLNSSVLQDALNLIIQSLTKSGIDIGAISGRPYGVVANDDSDFAKQYEAIPDENDVTTSMGLEFSFATLISDLDLSDIHVDSDTMNTFANLEPMSTTVGALEIPF